MGKVMSTERTQVQNLNIQGIQKKIELKQTVPHGSTGAPNGSFREISVRKA